MDETTKGKDPTKYKCEVCQSPTCTPEEKYEDCFAIGYLKWWAKAKEQEKKIKEHEETIKKLQDKVYANTVNGTYPQVYPTWPNTFAAPVKSAIPPYGFSKIYISPGKEIRQLCSSSEISHMDMLNTPKNEQQYVMDSAVEHCKKQLLNSIYDLIKVDTIQHAQKDLFEVRASIEVLVPKEK